jgi:16S rRNA (guanine527-N7)-methyltransferase
MMFDQPEVIRKYFPEISGKQEELFYQFSQLFALQNEKLNLVSKSDVGNLFTRHILHSLSIARFINFKEGTRVMDLGSGGGFPGIPLAIYFPGTNFTLVDSIAKKIRAVDTVLSELGLLNVESICARAENVKQRFDFVVTRAAASSEKLIGWTSDKILKSSFNDLENGIIALKGGDLSEELSAIRNKYELVDISTYFNEEFFQTKKIIYIKH